jgi:ParB family chromosome partitioning protein
MMDVDKLNPHPKNKYFFDDIDGEPWVAFLESIKTSGVIEPIIVSAPDLTIVSGHQRVRACQKLGIKQVAVEERSYESEDEILKQLIETNIRQRGVGNTNAVKLGRCIKELERIYGIKNGGDRKSEETKLPLKSQGELAEELDMSKVQLRKYKSLADLIPELQDAVQSGQITATTAMGFVKKLSPEEQKKLAESINGQDKVSGKEVEKYVAEIRRLGNENEQLHHDNRNLSRQLKEMEEPKVIEKTIEVAVVPDDYEETKKQLQMYRGDNERLNRESKERNKELEEAKLRVKELEGRSAEAEMTDKAIREAEYFEIAAYDFIKRCGGYVWLCDRVNDMPEGVSKKFKKALFQLNAMTTKMLEQTGGYIDGE